MINFSDEVKVSLVAAGQVSAGTAINSTAVDMAGFEGVVFVGSIATSNAANFANLAQGDTSGGAFVDLAGTKVVPGDDGDSFLLDIFRPRDRFVRLEIDRGGANTATGDVYAFQYGPASAPVSHGSTIDAELHLSPAEGAA